MSVDSLRAELLSLPGVAAADVDGEGEVPSNVRVRLHPEADPRAVGADVQRVLAAHGMRSRVTGDDAPAEPPLSPPVEAVLPSPPPIPPPLPEPPASAPDPVTLPEPGAAVALASLTVEESADGVTVIATAGDGRRFSQRAAASAEAVAGAVVLAVGALAEGRPPRLLAATLGITDGTEVATVLVERSDGTRLAGACVVRAGRPYAIARATWAALRCP